jgi:hypothetical protein
LGGYNKNTNILNKSGPSAEPWGPPAKRYIFLIVHAACFLLSIETYSSVLNIPPWLILYNFFFFSSLNYTLGSTTTNLSFIKKEYSHRNYYSSSLNSLRNRFFLNGVLIHALNRISFNEYTLSKENPLFIMKQQILQEITYWKHRWTIKYINKVVLSFSNTWFSFKMMIFEACLIGI